jgi:hypothetical protein
MGRRPHSGSVGWLGSLALVAVIASACGSATTATVTAHATVSPTPAPVVATPTLPVLPPPAPIAPLLASSQTGNFTQTLYSTAGVPTATLPAKAPYQIVSPLGDRLLAEQTTTLDNQGFYGIDALDAISATGSVSKLETITDPNDFIDAIGSETGTQWAWMLKGPVGGCAGTPPPPTDTYVYVSSTPGQASLVAKLPPLKPNGVAWTFLRWTAAGIVLSEGSPPGCYEGPPINTNPTDLLNPSTGTVTPLAPKLGTGDCILQDIADDGTMACIPYALVSDYAAPAASATVLRIVFPDGTEHDVTATPFLQGCDVSRPIEFGGVLLSAGPEFVTLDRWCAAPRSGNEVADVWIIDVETLDSVKVSVTGLGATGWLPGTTTLIATGDLLEGSDQNTEGTYTVDAGGTATKLTAADIEPQSFVHI